MIEQLDYLVRLIAIGAALMLIAQMVASEVRDHIKFPLVAMVVGVVAYLLNASPLMTAEGPLDPWVDLFAISSPYWIWLFARRLFEAEPERRVALGAMALLLVGWIIGNFIPGTGRLGFYMLHIVALALIADLVRVGLAERNDDLVEERRMVRLWLPLLVAAQAGGILLFETIVGASGEYPPIQLANSVLIVILTLFAGVALLDPNEALLIESEEDLPGDEPEPLDLSPTEKVLHENLVRAMAEGAYREPGLTIAALAAQLDTPEHRLRALINQRLGHRNFSAFLNRHRIAEAKERLADKETVDLPVLTIAMDLGYNSLTPFNRAFREQTGTTPSEFRRLSMANGADEAGVTQSVQN
ncbi:transcriptional regulatory protein [Erythrobacter sp. NAP1]|uniref:AraC family transcriptional regulator n=1 Tax=Erythrobacter sp. NAP1 TaxID=237727 RepID=UPI0000686E89|nr:helix-turn-helix domain-containing protein [Erythrobacter sp. NAP1]EAQ29558.1 transcriptional regulatory protein [Erythrobacter sp. NAP1]